VETAEKKVLKRDAVQIKKIVETPLTFLLKCQKINILIF
jgi:hypothetical protein